jgi:hypothetical protein
MTWQVLGGDAHEIYLALLKERFERDDLGMDDDVPARQFRLHLHRRIAYLAAPQAIRSIGDLIRLTDVENGEHVWEVRQGWLATHCRYPAFERPVCSSRNVARGMMRLSSEADFWRAFGGFQGVHGMTHLLDAHSLLWALDDPAKLGVAATSALQDPANQLKSAFGAFPHWNASGSGRFDCR